MAKKPKLQAVSYLRVSGKGQLEGSGLDRQAETIAAWAKHNTVEIVRAYREEGVSGTKDETTRPAFADMVTDLLSNCCRTIVVESLDRFARDLGVQMQLLAYITSKGLTLISASTGEDITAAVAEDPMRRAMVQMQGVFSELDKSLLVRKLRKGRETAKAETGVCEGRKPYGAKPGESEIVARIVELRRKPIKGARLSFAAIAQRLNDEAVPTRTGGQWRPSTVGQILERA